MRFCKYHGCGNDFIITDYADGDDYSALAQKWCDRKTGIGADGFIAVRQNPLEMVFYNMDGSRAPMCGNGIRCFAAYCARKNIVDSDEFDVNTLAGVMKIKITDRRDFSVRVDMGSPVFDNKAIAAADDENCFGREISALGVTAKIYSFFMGTVHTVIFVDSVGSVSTEYADAICNHSLFTEKTNVNFVKVVDDKTFDVATYERGVGWTCACGTGACAAFVAGRANGFCGDYVNVRLKYGTLKIEKKDKNIFMTGPASFVFEGETEV